MYFLAYFGILFLALLVGWYGFEVLEKILDHKEDEPDVNEITHKEGFWN